MLVNFIPKKARNARMLADVGHGAMEGAPVNLARMSLYDTLGIVTRLAGSAISFVCCCCLRAERVQLRSKLFLLSVKQ